IARDRDRPAEEIAGPGVRSLEISLLDPVCPVAHENVGRARVPGAVVRLDPVDAAGVAVLANRADDHRISRDCNRPAQVITCPKIYTCFCWRWSPSVGGFDVGLLNDGSGQLAV